VSQSRSSESHAKFIVSGEHAVLAGAPCLVYPLKQLRLGVEIVSSKHFEAVLNGKVLSEDLAHKVWSASLRSGHTEEALRSSKICISTSIPIASGLGSSAALCVALARLTRPEGEVFSAAHHAEGVFHGRSSGADPAGVMAKGPILYDVAKGPNYEAFVAAKDAPYTWVLCPSGAERSTSHVISNLADSSKENLMASLIEVSKKIPRLLREGSWTALPEAIEEATEIHRKMGLVNESLDATFKRMRSEGAVATKLTGAGRGGFALGLYPLELATKLSSTKSEHLLVPLHGN